MARPHCVGIGLGHLDAHLAHWAPETPSERLQTFLLERLPGPAVVCRPAALGPLPFSFAPGRTFGAGELTWLEALLTHLRRSWLPTLPPGEVRTALSLPPGTNPADRARCCGLARRCGWEQARVVDDTAAAAVALLGPTASPLTALIVQTGLESVHLSLVTVLKRLTRVRGHLRLRCLSHAGLDEAILAVIGANVAAHWPENEAGRLEVWADAEKVRQQLDASPAGAAVLSAPAWGLSRAGTVSVGRDDLWPLLQADCQIIADAASELLAQHQVSQEELAQVLLAGGGVLAWERGRELLAARLNRPPSVVPSGAAAAGGALLAAEPDAVLGDDVVVPEAAWARAWETRLPSSLAAAAGVRIRVEWGPGTAPTRGPRVAPDADGDYRRALETAWGYLRGVASENPSRARQLAEEVLAEAETFLDSLPAEEDGRAASSPLLAQAAEALRAGDPRLAVDLAHQARDDAPQDPQVFRQMINLHIQAADACTNPEEAVAWLECANCHDQANRLVHQHLAMRYREYARTLADAGRGGDAMKAARRSLDFEPFNSEGMQLVADLERVPPRPVE
jgi:hypothetical protein